MKKQFITAFTGGESDVEFLKGLTEFDGNNLSFHIREAIKQYVDTFKVPDLRLGDILQTFNDDESESKLKKALINKVTTYKGEFINEDQVDELFKASYSFLEDIEGIQSRYSPALSQKRRERCMELGINPDSQEAIDLGLM